MSRTASRDRLVGVMHSSGPCRLIEAGVLFLLVFTPLAYGAVEPWSEAVVELVVLAIAVIYIIGSLRDWELRIELPPGWVPMMLFLGLVVFQAVVPGWSMDPHATWKLALKLLAVAAFYLVCWNTYRTRAQAERAIWTMVIMGTLLSVFGIVQRMAWNGHLYWLGREAPTSAFGPFVNRTHFAGLMIIVVPLAFALVLASQRPERPATRRWRLSWGDRLREWNSQHANVSNLLGFLILIMGGAAFVSGSRGGVLALLSALAAMVLGFLTGERSWSGRVARLGFIALLTVLAGVWMSSEVIYGTIERLAAELGRPDESGRIRIWRDAFLLWHSAPIVGTGLASFGVAFPAFRTIEAPFVFTHAESDWVQLLTDTGLVGVVLVIAGVCASGIGILRRWTTTDPGRHFQLAAAVTLLAFGIHSFANYNTSITGILIYLALGLAIGGGYRGSEVPSATRSRHSRGIVRP
jgi:O-antigen ligase